MNESLNSADNSLEKIFYDAKDFLPLFGTDYIELYVGNAKQAAHFYKTAFGFQSLAYRGLETGSKNAASYVLKQGKIRLVLTTPLHSKSPINDHLRKHGDGVKVIALLVDDAKAAHAETTKRGAKSYFTPKKSQDEHGVIITSGIYTYGETVHVFVERKNYKGVFFPGYEVWNSTYNPPSSGLKFIDHIVGNVGWGQMDIWVQWYEEVMGFVNFLSFDDKQIHTEYSALMSKVMSNGNGRIKFPINEPAEAEKRSQIEEYLDFYEDSGVQHLAVATDDIITTVKQLKKNGVEFLPPPPPSLLRCHTKPVGGSYETHERRHFSPKRIVHFSGCR